MGPLVHSPSEEYRALVDKAYSKFARLRDFPPYGRNRWDYYFHKAFQVYSKLWKFQQEHRHQLVEVGLKRWEIGEIASRIGQLYYNYYLRTSDAKFLSESFIFYEAILTRDYFKDSDKDAPLANKQLRYCARFIVICLLLNRREMVQLLVRQLRTLVEEFSRSHQSIDAKEWKVVVQEIIRFMKADAACEISRPLRYSVLLDPHPLSIPAVDRLEGAKPLRLEDAILASYHHNEVKFSELSLDTFRMLQALEWEPSGSLYRTRVGEVSNKMSSSGHVGVVEEIPDPSLPPNPHKYVLYRPSVQHLLLVLATVCEEVPANSCVLLYVAASGRSARTMSSHPSSASLMMDAAAGNKIVSLTPTLSLNQMTINQIQSYMGPGIDGRTMDVDQNNTSAFSTPAESPRKGSYGDRMSTLESSESCTPGLWLGSRKSPGMTNFLYPSDILPFTRRPLFIVVDSDNSAVFETLSGNERGEPAVLLLSPSLQPDDKGMGVPASVSYPNSCGNVFTFFLTAPLLAFCRVNGISVSTLPKGTLQQTEKLLSKLLADLGNALASSTSISHVWARVLYDPFLRQLVVRFIFCRGVFALHLKYRHKPEFLPRCYPALPEEVLPNTHKVGRIVYYLAIAVGAADQFEFPHFSFKGTSDDQSLLEEFSVLGLGQD
ncbi:uncharacterized protein [Physcomitrium patens]|uniref:Protein SCAI n=1 Tax=Physcomitrium patens TaxID=3218 RepID=A0A2K1IN62_PHYPA|nr:protein SCAI-like [Physcomitrium patens]XP_024361146.1 protein SCAI-like [Physcomitrium patens]XP_024361147.1 protein SCAI-like [Physcomitrium patens]XP_024361149.1 protein SCAI-like [Physcomitrium patens]XP_024361150.1 protein SCAI-like [Physcomitrium patens]XP_024361151.1 protein SCAI-like [Physcomitrium patens]PNR30707.1 hypothetical protein PHYPA_027023 [Physcomitrium patens]|eukprot:XP_024361145.1 protein SCAI-like [Physcomitrella patens]